MCWTAGLGRTFVGQGETNSDTVLVGVHGYRHWFSEAYARSRCLYHKRSLGLYNDSMRAVEYDGSYRGRYIVL